MEGQNPPGAAAAVADPEPGPAPQAPRNSSAPARGQPPAQPLYLKALTIPLFQPVPPGSLQPLVPARSCVHLDGGHIPLILNPLLPADGTERPPPPFQKQLGQSLTLSIVSTLPVLSSPTSCVNASVGKSKKSGKYICKHCGRDCLKPSVLEKHIRSHTGERPFPCTTCGIAFKTQSNLYKHRRTQTHVNNTRLPSEPDISGGAEQNERPAESTDCPQGSKVLSSISEDQGIQIKQPSSDSSATDTEKPHELSLSATSTSSTAPENQETTHQSFSSKANQGVPEREPRSLSSPGALSNGPCLRKKMQEQRTPTANKHIQLQRQQATSSEKQWDYKPLECRLKKCESTDSGYLSRSDSTEQQMPSSSPLHSLHEHSTELETETAFSSPRCAPGSTAKPEGPDKATASMLEKKRLEEHISKLISHNKSVVDDTHLDNVRPRKTVLSKQGSIDLPMPYTYKDSFHFDIRTCDVNRKKNISLCSAKSTFAPLEKCKPMFFHSVPTQFSTTIDTVPVTRSNSLPVVEAARMVHDKPGCSKPLSLTKQSVNTGTAALLPSNNLAANSVDFPNSHPRALVRQTAVDDLPLSNVADHPSLSEELKGSKKLGAGEVISAKNKKHNQRKLKMFSQEKWQMYGDETFKKIYQKMKTSQNAKKIKQRGNKITDTTSFTPNSGESASSTEITEERDDRSSVSDSRSSLVTAASTTSKSGTCTAANRVLQNVSSEETADRVSHLMETSHPITAGAGTSQTSRELCGSDTEKCTAGSRTLLALSSAELRLQNPECQLSSHGRNEDSLPVQSGKWEKPNPGKESSAFELDCKSPLHNYGNHHGTKESGQHGPTPPWVHCNNRETAGKSQTLPSERKKLKFEVEKTQNVISVSCPSPGSETPAVSEAEKVPCSGTQSLATAPVKFSSKSEEQKSSTGINESTGRTENVEYMKTVKLPTKTLNYSDINLLSHPAGTSKASLVGFLGSELRGSDSNSSALHNAADGDDKTHLVKTAAKVPLLNDNAVDVSSKSHHLQSGNLSPVPQQNAFSPKYILKLPQDKRASDLSLLLRSEQEMTPGTPVGDSLTSPPCSSSSTSLHSHSDDVIRSPLKSKVRQKTGKGDIQWNLHTNWKNPGFCSPVKPETTNTLTTAENTFHNQNFRQQDIAREDWKNKQNKNKFNCQRQTEEKWMSKSTCSKEVQTPKKKICFTSVYTSGFFISADIKDERKALHHLCSGSDSRIKTSASSKGAEPTILGWDRVASPRILKDIPPPLQDLQHSQSSRDNPAYFCHSFGTFYCHTLSTHCKEFPVLPHNNRTCYSGTSPVLGSKSTFPSLSAEPRLTWCCLSRSLPLPSEQSGDAGSAHSSEPTCDKESSRECTLSKYDISIFKMKNISKTVAYGLTNTSLKSLVSSFSKGHQMQELSTTAPGGSFKNISEQKKKAVVCKKEKFSTNKLKRSHKQKRIKVTPKWYRGRHIHGFAQLKMNRLSKRPCFPNRALDALRKGCSSQPPRFNKHKKCYPPQSKMQENYLHQQKDTSYSTSDKPLCRRKKEAKNNSGISSHIENLNHIKQKDKMDKKDIAGQIREHPRTNASVQNITAPLGIAVTAHSFSSTADTSVQEFSRDVAICCWVTQPLVLQHSLPGKSMAASFRSCPPEFTNPSTGDQLDSTNPGAAVPLSLHPGASQENSLRVESESQIFGLSDPVIQASGREKFPTEENKCLPPKENPSPSSQLGCSHLFGSPAEAFPESVRRARLPSREHSEREDSSQHLLDLHGSADKKGSHLQHSPYGRPHGTAPATFRKLPITLRSPEFKSYSATPPKTYKKRGLEMMRKQTRVDYDDTSSDDEDRLVIEI